MLPKSPFEVLHTGAQFLQHVGRALGFFEAEEACCLGRDGDGSEVAAVTDQHSGRERVCLHGLHAGKSRRRGGEAVEGVAISPQLGKA